MLTTLLLLVLGLVQSAQADKAQRTAIWSRDTNGSPGLFLYSATPVRDAILWSSERKAWLTTSQAYPKVGKAFPYRLPIGTEPSKDTEFYVSGILEDGSRFTDTVTITERGPDRVDAEVENQRIETPEEVAAFAKAEQERLYKEMIARTSGDRLRFIDILNHYRARNGCGAVVYDEYLASVSQTNNLRGGGHVYTAGNPQNWAMSGGGMYPEQALRQWQNSGGHNALLLNRWITRVGISIDGNQATMTAN